MVVVWIVPEDGLEGAAECGSGGVGSGLDLVGGCARREDQPTGAGDS